jgi:hypothetical protein
MLGACSHCAAVKLRRHLHTRCAPPGVTTRAVHHQVSSAASRPVPLAPQVLKGSKAFVVEPLSGLVPANGQAYISVTFTPLAFRSEELQLQVEHAAAKHAAAKHAAAAAGSSSRQQPSRQQQ